MGWLFTKNATKKDIVNKLIEPTERQQETDWSNEKQQIIKLDNDISIKTIAHKLVGKILYQVVEITRYYHNDTKSTKFILISIIEKQRNYGYGYKSMSEASEPYYYDCPLKFLELAQTTNQQWRDKVIKKHNTPKTKIGDIITLTNTKIPFVKITSTKPLLGDYQGKIYRIPKKMISQSPAMATNP